MGTWNVGLQGEAGVWEHLVKITEEHAEGIGSALGVPLSLSAYRAYSTGVSL